MGVAELARALALPKGTVHGILRTLQVRERTGHLLASA
jgi:DNA-binding IclR family transcriptional regulator